LSITTSLARLSRRRMLAALGLLMGDAILGRPARAQAETDLRLVAFGDSLTAGYGIAASDAFPAKLEAALRASGHGVRIANAGVSGDTTTGGLARLDWSIPDGTHGVILELGANDMLRGVDPEISRRALDDIMARLTARNIPILLCGMQAAPNLGADYGARFDAIFPTLARQYDAVFYPFFLQDVVGQRRLNLPDGLHPTAAGVDVIVRGIMPKAKEFVARVSARLKS
jgi:acyl-CoA thioesterase-1